jgi:hypothetical protein
MGRVLFAECIHPQELGLLLFHDPGLRESVPALKLLSDRGCKTLAPERGAQQMQPWFDSAEAQAALTFTVALQQSAGDSQYGRKADGRRENDQGIRQKEVYRSKQKHKRQSDQCAKRFHQ